VSAYSEEREYLATLEAEAKWLEGRPTWRDVFWMAVLLMLVVLAGSVTGMVGT
jgi:hypothetical protein